MNLSRPRPRTARIEIVPMIDTVFFLLVFFMMATLSMAVYRGVPVNLPTAQSGEPAADNAAVTLTRDGATYLDREPVAPDTLGRRFRALLDRSPRLLVVINADADVPHRRVVAVMDAARMAGIARMAIAVTPDAAAAGR